MTVLVGVDGGGTHTRALAVTHAGEILGRGQAGPPNHQVVGVEGAIEAVREAVFAATAGRHADAVGACLAGVDLPEHVELLRGGLIDRMGDGVHVENDIAAALWATPGTSVGVVASGTGAAVAVRRGGEMSRLLALNDFTGPEGGAGDIATLAVREAILAAQGAAPPTRLTDRILAVFGLPDYVALARATEGQGMPTWQVAMLVAPLCAQLAGEGDARARQILRHMGARLGTVAGRYFAAQGLAPGSPVGRYGSLLRGGPRDYREAFGRALRRHFAATAAPRASLDAVQGAVLFAADRAGCRTGELVQAMRRPGA